MTKSDYELKFTEDADLDMAELKSDNSKRAVAKAVVKSLKFMKVNLKHPSLNTHKYDEMEGPNGRERFLSLMLKIIRQELIEYFGSTGPEKDRNNYCCYSAPHP